MGKRLKYVPTNPQASSSITFSSPEGSINFPYIGAELTVTSQQFESLTQNSLEFKNCCEARVIITETTMETPPPQASGESEKEELIKASSPESEISPEALSGVPRTSLSQEQATPKVTSKKSPS